MKPITRLLHTKIDLDGALPSVTPLFQTSGFEAGSPYFYTRKNNPNVAEFEQALEALEGCAHAIGVTTGMTAISLVLSLLKPGDRLVLNSHIYGCSYRLVHRTVEQYNLELVVLDLSREENLELLPEARMVLFETPTNPFLKTVDIRRVSERAKGLNPDCLVVVDNTWATPYFQQPLKHGADISLHSATKFLSGHADVMGGILLTDRSALAESLADARFYAGAILDPHSAWLLRRSLQTLGLRMEAHQAMTNQLVAFLAACPQVRRVFTACLDNDQISGYGGILFFELESSLVVHYPAFAAHLEFFGTGTSMACVTSMVAQPYSGSHASMSHDEKSEMGLGPELIRLCFGFEDLSDLRDDLTRAFSHIQELAS